MRGVIAAVTIEEAVERAKSMIWFEPELPEDAGIGAKSQPIRYRLPKFNGGKDPLADHPADWSYGKRSPTCDCIGFIAWSLGFDRYQPVHFDRNKKGKVIYGGYINTNSSILAANSLEPSWFEEVCAPELGCLVVYGGTRNKKTGKRRAGHIGIVVGPLPAEWDPEANECWRALRVVHCSSSNDRITGGAIQETDGWTWRHSRRPSKFLRYLRAA